MWTKISSLPSSGFMKAETSIGYPALYGVMLMRWLGESLTPWPINREIGTLADDLMPGRQAIQIRPL
jgi:hypothetical protein